MPRIHEPLTLTPTRLEFLLAHLGFSLTTLADLFHRSKNEIHELARKHGIRRFRGATYWRWSPRLTESVAERLELAIPGSDWHLNHVQRLLRDAIQSAVREQSLDPVRLDALLVDLPALTEAEGLSRRESDRLRASRSFGGSFPWLTERRLEQGLRPRLGRSQPRDSIKNEAERSGSRNSDDN